MKRGFRNRRFGAGFTLVEVMVALLVVAIALPALLSRIASQAEGTADLRDRSQARWVAENRLAILRLEYRLNGQLLRGQANGESEMLERPWHWRADSEETEFSGMWRQTVEVGYEGDDTLYSLVGFLRERREEADDEGER